MGIYPRSDLHRPSASPDTPPLEVESPKPYPFSFRPSQGRSRQLPAPISPPMSSYDKGIKPGMSTGNGTEDRHRGDASRSVSQQQQQPQQPSQQLLPSLSSIFGPPSQMRPLQSPMSERPSPLYSPLERPHSAAANPDRSQPQSYFPTVSSTPVVQPRTILEPRLSGRTSLPSAGSLFPGPLSPRAREFDQAQHRPRESSVPNTHWTASSGHTEYVYGSHGHQEPPSAFRPVNNALGHAPSHEPMRGPRESVASGYASAASNVVSEGAPGKDSLGPKIWTGTHFLPRFVRQAEYPGEGLCYFYDDGTHCKTVIDGEPVNAHWGVTKAGKPRKRLAIACLTCREKKIKCDPDFPRCVQCEKFGRVCKFKNAPRGGHNPSPVTSPGGQHEEMRPGGSQAHAGESGRQRSISSTSVSPRTTAIPHHSPELSGLPSKRMRVDYDQYRPAARDELRFFEAPEHPEPSLSWQKRDLPRIHEDLLCRAWQTNPYVSDPQATSTAIASFFDHVETAALRFLPAQLFRDWVKKNAHTKSPEDLMLLYSISAFGLHASGGPRRLAHEYAETARFACERSAPGLQLVQTKLILSLYYLANARALDSYECLGGAIAMALSLQFNVELDETAEATPLWYPYGMNRATYEESRRRTFFSCFVLERTNGLFPSRPALIRADDIFVRLPCDEAVFDDNMSAPSETSAFDVAREMPSSDSGVGIMGYLVNIVEIYGRVLAGVQKEARGSAPVDSDARFIERIGERVRQYQDALPAKFRFSNPNLARATDEGVDGSLITLHLVLLLTRTKFARHAQSEVARTLQAETISQKCIMLAGDLMFATTALRDQLVERRDTAEPFLPTTFAAHAAVEAIDILTASGTAQSVSASIQEATAAQELCDAICSVWQCARVQKKVVDERAEALGLLRDRPAGEVEAETETETEIPGCQVSQPADAGPFQFRFVEPLEKRFPLRLDAIYGSRSPIRG